MTFLVVYSSPNANGLTAACAAAAAEGIAQADAQVQVLRLNDLDVGKCRACNDGWGSCRSQHQCQVQDGFQDLHARVMAADGLILVTPVYWGDSSESMKAFVDRMRRCEASAGETSRLLAKPVIAVACAGGTGNGTVTCLLNLDNWIKHVRARMFDLVPVTRWSRAWKLDAIRESARAMAAQVRSKPEA
jgi:multimeric flavodoxin WrbA